MNTPGHMSSGFLFQFWFDSFSFRQFACKVMSVTGRVNLLQFQGVQSSCHNKVANLSLEMSHSQPVNCSLLQTPSLFCSLMFPTAALNNS